MIPNPKQRFLDSTAVAKWHADLVAKSEFIQALDAAKLEYADACAKAMSPGDVGLMLRGATEFARIFCELSMPLKTRTIKDHDNLS